MTCHHATPDIDTEIRLRYSAIRSGVPDGIPATVLHIGAQQTAVATGSGSEPEVTLTLAIGSCKTATDYFKHEPPTPAEVENAIIIVEDEMNRARAMIVGGAPLFTTDVDVRRIALIAGVPKRPELILTLDAMERTFARLIAVTQGRPATHEGIPTSATFAATLLILREFMHHLHYASITVKAHPGAGADRR